MTERRESLQYLVDSQLMEQLYQWEFGLSKQAGLFEDLNLGSLSQSIQNFVKDHVSADHPGGYVGSVADLLAPAVFFRINPFFGVIYLVASQLGFDISGTISKIFNALKPKLEAGTLTADEVSSIGKNIVASEVGTEATAAPDDLFEPLRKFSYSQIEKQAQLFGGRSSYSYKGPSLFDSLPKVPFLFGGKGSTLERIFGQLLTMPRYGRSKALWLVGGFIIWMVKTILVGAGLLAGAEAVQKLIKPEEKVEEKTEAPKEQPVETQVYEVQEPEAKPTPTSLKTTPKINFQANELWVVPLVAGSVEETLLAWVKDIYPNIFSELPELETDILRSIGFQSLVTLLKDPKRLSSKSLVMPSQFSNRKEVVDLILKDIK